MFDLKSLAELLYLVAFYRRHDQTDVAIQLLQNFVKQDSGRSRNSEYKRVLALSLYNLAELGSDEGDRLIASKLYKQAVDLWNEIEPQNPVDILFYQGGLQRLREETDRLVLFGAQLKKRERDIA